MTERSAVATPQPAPAPGRVDVTAWVVRELTSNVEFMSATRARCIEDLEDRSEMGRAKYGTALFSDNGRDALMDAYQESIDQVKYLGQWLIEEESKPRTKPPALHQMTVSIRRSIFASAVSLMYVIREELDDRG